MRSFINSFAECDITENSAIYYNAVTGKYLASRRIDSPEDSEKLINELFKSGYKEIYRARA